MRSSAHHPVACDDRLRSHVPKSDVVHRVVERLVHGVDVDLLGPVRVGSDPLQQDAGFGEPAADVGDEILRGPPLVEVPGLRDLVLRQGIDEPVELRPEPILLGDQLAVRTRL